jgi:predicted Zn-dependent protease
MLGAGLARFDDPDAEGVLRLAAVTSPGLALARFHYGSYLAREGILDLAVAELGAAREIEPENPEVLREIAIAHLLAGADSLATDALEDASALAPDDADLHLLHALTLLRRGSVAEAAEELHATAHAFDHDMEIQLLAALACASQEWTDEAWSALTRAEAAADASDEPLVREVEELIEAGPAPAQEFLVTQLAPGVLRERLFTRS